MSCRHTKSRDAVAATNTQQQRTLVAIAQFLLLPAALTALVTFVGCGGSSELSVPTSSSGSAEDDVDNLSRAKDLFARRDEFDPDQVSDKVVRNLKRWIEEQEPDKQWTRDPLVDRLPSQYRETLPIQNLDVLDFYGDDYEFLEETAWMRDVAEWVTLPGRESNFAPWIEPAMSSLNEDERKTLVDNDDQLAAAMRVFDSSLNEEDAAKLAAAFRLFDWTIRNIQLDPLLPQPKGPVVGPAASPQSPDAADVPLALRGIPGPGYQHFPWQNLMYGHGDAWQRARVFILLCRQAGIDVVMLAFDEGTRTSRPRPWLPAAVLNGQLYFFDTALGLPIPAPNHGIATLKQVRDEPAILRSLDADEESASADAADAGDDDSADELRYPVDESDLGQVVALIDAAPAFLSQRMKILEQNLTGDNKMILTSSPSLLADEIRRCDGINQVSLWTVPLDAMMYSFAMQQILRNNPEAWREHVRAEERLFHGTHPLISARRRHFRGALDKQESEDEVGAKIFYLESRVSDEMIDMMEDTPEVQRQFGLTRSSGEDQATFSQRLRDSIAFFKTTKMHAGYWLGLAQFDSGHYDVAVDWFARALEKGAASPWEGGARYNLARSFEAMGDWDKARELYLADDSPQRLGNRLRARIVEQRMTSTPADG